MNVKMLQCLVELCEGDSGAVQIEEFKKHYAPSRKTASDARSLRDLGFISFAYADDEISEIIINQSAVDYFKK